MKGRNSTVPRSPIWRGVAWSMTIATSGIASWLTWVPNWLIVSPVHSFMKSGWCQRLGRGEAFAISVSLLILRAARPPRLQPVPLNRNSSALRRD